MLSDTTKGIILAVLVILLLALANGLGNLVDNI